MKKTLSIILAILMLVTSVPFAFAAEETPPTRVIDGETYYELDSAEDYLWFVQMCNDSVNPDEPDYEYEDDWYHQPHKDYYIPFNAILTGDIVINSNVIVDGELTEDTASLIEVDPIAKYYEEPETYSYNTSYYTGTFDGNGYSISGLYMCNTDREYAMFRSVHNDGVVKNLHIKDSYFTGDWSIAALVGSNNGTISGCSFDGIVYATSWYAGGLVSYNSGIIENSYNAGHVHSAGHQNAGIAISNDGTIRNCYNIGTVGNTTGASQVGGITGNNRGSIENCYNIGEVYGHNSTAPISAYNQNSATITNCYFNSEIFSGTGIGTNFNEAGTTNVEGKTAAEIADSGVCTLVGYHGYVNAECAACGMYYEHEHTTENQSCMGYKCKYCGIYHGEAAPDNHTYGNYKATIEAECESTGVETAVCIHCGVAKLEREIPEKGHDWSNKDGICANNCGLNCEHESYTDAVCDTCGYECEHKNYTKGVCDACKYVCFHSFTVFNETVAPKCEETGWEESYCDFGCGIKLEQEIPAIDHDWGVELVERPTQNTDGTWNDGYYYSVCNNDGEHIKMGDVAKRGDYGKFNELLGKARAYYSDETITDEAKEEIAKIINLPIFGYMPQNLIESELNVYVSTLDKLVAKIEAGIEDGTLVKVDGVEYFNKLASDFESEMIEKYGDECFDISLTDETQARFNEIGEYAESLAGTVAENKEALAEIKEELEAIFAEIEKCLAGTHSFANYEVTSPAKCEVNAKETGTCAVCGETDEREVENSALAHSFTTYEEATAPECGKAGLEKAICDNGCGETDEREIDALEHSFLEYISNGDATCTADGTMTAECANGCGETDTVADVGTKLDHADEDGDKVCDDCEAEIVDTCPDCGRPVHEGQINEYICLLITLIRLIVSLVKSIGIVA